MRNKHIFCARKNSCTIKGRMYPHPLTSGVISERLRVQSNKKERQYRRRMLRAVRFRNMIAEKKALRDLEKAAARPSFANLVRRTNAT